MGFDPGKPFEMVDASAKTSGGFDPGKPFQMVAAPASDPVTDSEGHLIANPAEALKSGAAFAQPAANIAEAGVKGAVEGFGHPMGQTILSPEAQDWMDAKQREGGVGGFLAGLGSTAAEDIGTVGGVLAGIPNAVFRGGQAAVAQTGAELGAPQLGRDIAAIPEAFMGSPSMLAKAPELSSGVLPTDRPYIPRSVAEGNLLLDYPRSPDVSVTARQIQARDGVGIMEAWNRAHTENNAAAIAKIGQATDIDGVIAAAGKAAEAPSEAAAGAPDAQAALPLGWSVDDRFGPAPGAAPAEATPYAPITSTQVQRRDGVGAIEAARRANAENAAGAAPPVPESVGAAASRDTTSLTSFGRSAREIKGQQADMELADLMRTPQPGDARDIIPGATQTRGEIELSPSVSREAKGLRQEFREGFNEHEKANNELYHDWVDDVTPTSEQIGTMKDIREAQWKADEATVFGPNPNGEAVSTAPIVQHLQEVFSDPVEKHNSYLQRAFQPLLDQLTDDNGAPIQIGAKELYGIRQEMGRKVKDMATDTDLAHLRGQFGDLMKVTDDAIVAGAPDYRAMMDKYREASIPINAGERLQEGALKITNGSDRTITFGKFDAFMKGLWMERNGPNPYAKAKAIDQATWDHLMQLHERLARSASDQELARTRGSDTTQLMMEMMRKGAIGTAHAIVGKLTGGLGNIAIPMITKQIDASRAMKRVGQHLNPDLSQYPNPGP